VLSVYRRFHAPIESNAITLYSNKPEYDQSMHCLPWCKNPYSNFSRGAIAAGLIYCAMHAYARQVKTEDCEGKRERLAEETRDAEAGAGFVCHTTHLHQGHTTRTNVLVLLCSSWFNR
jgi:hypothetical protein